MDFSEQWNLETIKRELEAHRRTEQYKHDILTDYYTSLPLVNYQQPVMPFISSTSSTSQNINDTMKNLYGRGVQQNTIIKDLIIRNEEQREQNRIEIEGDEDFQARAVSNNQGDELQRQSLEIYFNELQDGGFGGTDVNRTNTTKALFNLKNVGLELSLSDIQRFQDISNEFIDSFILTVDNPQFSELLIDGKQKLTSGKNVDILKKSLSNLDSIENVLRILKVLNVLEESLNLQDIQRQPIFDRQFDEIIKAKPQKFIPDKFRALLTKSNGVLNQLKDKLDGIQDIRDKTANTGLRENIINKENLTPLYNRMVNYVKNDLFAGIKQAASRGIPKRDFFFFLKQKLQDNPDEILSIVGKFFQTQKTREYVSSILKDVSLTPSIREALLNLINGKNIKNSIDVITTSQSKLKTFGKDINEMIEKLSNETNETLDKLVNDGMTKIDKEIDQITNTTTKQIERYDNRRKAQLQEMTDEIKDLEQIIKQKNTMKAVATKTKRKTINKSIQQMKNKVSQLKEDRVKFNNTLTDMDRLKIKEQSKQPQEPLKYDLDEPDEEIIPNIEPIPELPKREVLKPKREVFKPPPRPKGKFIDIKKNLGLKKASEQLDKITKKVNKRESNKERQAYNEFLLNKATAVYENALKAKAKRQQSSATAAQAQDEPPAQAQDEPLEQEQEQVNEEEEQAGVAESKDGDTVELGSGIGRRIPHKKFKGGDKLQEDHAQRLKMLLA
jgi:hypothetical protein